MYQAVEITCCLHAEFVLAPNPTTGNPGSVMVPRYGSSKTAVFVWGKNTILKFVGNTK